MAASRALGGLERLARGGESQLQGFQQAGVSWGCSGQGKDRGVRRGICTVPVVTPPLLNSPIFGLLACGLIRGSSGFVLTEVQVSLSPAPPAQEDLIPRMKSLLSPCQLGTTENSGSGVSAAGVERVWRASL